ncbi:uncharacterized protein CIMG_13361 [Coccidioides immitis RS]|uniref:Uncharacterized protein n=1 Tax=Coccidioides immitis (strain RS) TaxID=246410 RepID=J3KDH6_COCIM|nr:uncharacterized protein CIMG_13361 [Coccidioides immitis RS]EAS33416.3 hypothetical protein CIMG_13361 [Coccidioides immitis RS]
MTGSWMTRSRPHPRNTHIAKSKYNTTQSLKIRWQEPRSSPIIRWRTSLWKYLHHEIFLLRLPCLCPFSDIGNTKNYDLFLKWMRSDSVGDSNASLPVKVNPVQHPAVRRLAHR